MIYFAKIRLFSALSCPSPEYPCQTFTQQLNLCGRKIVQPSPRRITRNIVRIMLQYLKDPLRLNDRLKRLISTDVNTVLVAHPRILTDGIRVDNRNAILVHDGIGRSQTHNVIREPPIRPLATLIFTPE